MFFFSLVFVFSLLDQLDTLFYLHQYYSPPTILMEISGNIL